MAAVALAGVLGCSLPVLAVATAGGTFLGAAAALARPRGGDGRAQRPEEPAPAAPTSSAGEAAPGRPPAGRLEAGPAAMAAERATVAAVAHDMSSPLSTLKSNLEWLRDALEQGRLRAPEEEAEAREVLRDARDAAERLRADVGALRARATDRGDDDLPPT